MLMLKKGRGKALFTTILAVVISVCSFSVSFAAGESYHGRVFCQVFVRSFYDSNNDGIGDLKGLTQKLDYYKNLGIKGLWLMPICESPSYHGYDVADYYKINPQYGTQADFRELLREAHQRDIKIIIDMVINHTSYKHLWFQDALKNGKYHDFYVWANKDTNTDDGIESWYNVAGTKNHFQSSFGDDMPDLNYDNPAVREEIKKIAKFYLEMGVDGFRMDAARWIYTNDVGKNVAWWQEYKRYIKKINKDAVIVGEVTGDSKTLAPYYQGLDSLLDFAIEDELLQGLTAKKALNTIAGRLQEIYSEYENSYEGYISSPFLNNHDKDRTMSTFSGDLNTAKRAAAILLTLPGTPHIYYGEELGMTGAGTDGYWRDPFVWDTDASKNCRWKKNQDSLEKVALSRQEQDPASLYNFYRVMIHLRNNNKILRLGDYSAISTSNQNAMAYKRVLNGETVYVYINASQNEVEEVIASSKAKVLYSNVRNDSTLSLNGKVRMSGNEILIMQAE